MGRAPATLPFPHLFSSFPPPSVSSNFLSFLLGSIIIVAFVALCCTLLAYHFKLTFNLGVISLITPNKHTLLEKTTEESTDGVFLKVIVLKPRMCPVFWNHNQSTSLTDMLGARGATSYALKIATIISSTHPPH